MRDRKSYGRSENKSNSEKASVKKYDRKSTGENRPSYRKSYNESDSRESSFGSEKKYVRKTGSEVKKTNKKFHQTNENSELKRKKVYSDSQDKKAYRSSYSKGSKSFSKPGSDYFSESDFSSSEDNRTFRSSGKKSKTYTKPKTEHFPDSKNVKKSIKPDLTRRQKNEDSTDELIRLNKFISNAGICSRREADELIAAGAVTVNGKIITEMGFKIRPTDIVNYGGQGLKTERKVYLLLNKPKDYITTASDPQDRKTVYALIKEACKERLYPVGRLDRNTTGLLLMTNDGELTDKLTHPSSRQKKIYHVELDRPLTKEHLIAISNGIELEDGFIKVDQVNYVNLLKNKKEIGVELHSGRNRIVRRIFEHFDYEVRKLDRVLFAGLTKKDLPRGKWRFLTAAEVSLLKMLPGTQKKTK